jgi:hypothetical protein
MDISYRNLFADNIQQFIQPFNNYPPLQLSKGVSVDVNIKERNHIEKINPIIKLASKSDTKDIIGIYRDTYECTYPYLEMMNYEEVSKMVCDPDVVFFVFKHPVSEETMGCYTVVHNQKEKLGYIRGFNLYKKFLGKVDVFKASLGAMLYIYKLQENKIFRWYGECRTAHAKSQFFLSAVGFKPIAFYPNKDYFYHQIESEILIISYDKRALEDLRCTDTPQVIPDVKGCYSFSDKKYNLGDCEVKNFNLKIDSVKVNEVKKRFRKEIAKDRFGYISVRFSIEDSDSYFEFLYTPQVQNFEKTKYKVQTIEELLVFTKEFAALGKKFNTRYSEVFVSAYKPEHQKVFRKFGFEPRGYIPSWTYNSKENNFEDCILFNQFVGPLCSMELLNEGKELLRYLNMNSEFVT